MRILLWALGALAILAVFGGIILQVAIARNGPAVLSAVDRLTGGHRGAARLASISTGEHPAQKLVVWGPENLGPEDIGSQDRARPVLMFAHGGSWRSGDPESYGFMARAFVPEGFLVVTLGYRLVKEGAPDGVYPAMLEDTARAIEWAYQEIEQYGGDPDRIVLMGHSAGAYNVVMTAKERHWLGSRGLDPDRLRGVIGMAGPYDFYPFDSESTIAAFGPASDPEATQVFNHVRNDAAPLLLIHGEQDTLVRPRNSRELAQLVEAAGGPVTLKLYPQMDHNAPLISLASPWREGRDVAKTISAFARKVTAPD